MLTFEKFEKVIKLKQQFDQHLNDAERVLGGNLIETHLVQDSEFIFDAFIDSHFTDEGSDLVYWWLYESVPKKIWDSNVEYDVEELKDLWDYIIKNDLLA